MAGHNQSQTPAEQAELVKYEQNLAACYEAEYLLSIKLQEECGGSLGGSTENGVRLSHPFYCDSYEVVWVPGINPLHLQDQGTRTVAKTNHLNDNLACDLSVDLPTTTSSCCSSDSYTLPIASVEERLGNFCGNSEKEEVDMDCSMTECDNTINHLSVENRETLDCTGKICTLEDQGYFEGPSRKRIRLQGE